MLVVDEAQLLSAELLEEIGLLLHQTANEKLLQIVLSGQPEIGEKLNQTEWHHIGRQVAVHCETMTLSLQETHDYIQHRFKIAGAKCPLIFDRPAVDAVYEFSYGIPRVINLLCDHALASAYLNRVRRVSSHFIEEAAMKIRFDDHQLPGANSHGLYSSVAVIAKVEALQPILNGGKVKTDEVIAENLVVAAPEASSDGHLRMLVLPAKGPSNRASRRPEWLPILSLIQALDRWSVSEKRWMLCWETGLAGGVLFTLTLHPGPLARWQHLAAMVGGYLGLLLISVSMGTGGFLLADECRSRDCLSTIKCLLKARIDGKLAPLIGHIREWLQAPLY